MELAGTSSGYGPARERFIGQVFNHLGGALVAFTLIEVVLFRTGLAQIINAGMRSIPWIAILGAFMIIGWLASRAAHEVKSLRAQYAALGVYILAEALIFVPLLTMANQIAPGSISNAALITIVATFGLIGVAYTSRKDFSFLGSAIKWGGVIAIILIVCGAIFGFQLGLFFSVAMVGLAGAAILHDASNIIQNYPEDRYVGASLQLFASVALMLWYVLRILMSLRD